MEILLLFNSREHTIKVVSTILIGQYEEQSKITLQLQCISKDVFQLFICQLMVQSEFKQQSPANSQMDGAIITLHHAACTDAKTGNNDQIIVALSFSVHVTMFTSKT